MKALKTLVFLFMLSFAFTSLQAQSDKNTASQRALIYADSLLNAFRDNNLNLYIEMSYPGIVSYYGGRKNFEKYILRERAGIGNELQAAPEKTELLQIVKAKKEWQCVIKKTCKTNIDGRKASIVSYLVGQSKDKGQSWKYFDVAINSVENVAYIMPDIFSEIAIPQRQVIFEKDQVAKNQ